MTVQVGDHTTMLVLPFGADFATPWPVVNFDTFDDRFARDWPDWRRVLIKSFEQALYYVFWWGDDRPVPDGIDDHIRAGTLTIEHLRDACIAEFMSLTCLACHAQIRVLVAEWVYTRILGIRLPLDESYRQLCPVCHERIAVAILEFVD